MSCRTVRLVLVLTTLTFTTSAAPIVSASTDSGEMRTVVRWSPSGSKALMMDEDMAGDGCTYSVSSSVRGRTKLLWSRSLACPEADADGPWPGDQVVFDAWVESGRAPRALQAQIVRHDLSLPPVVGSMAPSGRQMVLIHEDGLSFWPVLVRQRSVHAQPPTHPGLNRVSCTQVQGSLDVYWHPAERAYAVAGHVADTDDDEDYCCSWAAYSDVVRLSSRPRQALEPRRLSEARLEHWRSLELATQCYGPNALLSLVALDPTHGEALLFAAAELARTEEHDALALELLSRLRALATPEAYELLARARQEPRFDRLKTDERFQALTDRVTPRPDDQIPRRE